LVNIGQKESQHSGSHALSPWSRLGGPDYFTNRIGEPNLDLDPVEAYQPKRIQVYQPKRITIPNVVDLRLKLQPSVEPKRRNTTSLLAFSQQLTYSLYLRFSDSN
jgi:hypothetical protein